MGGDVRPGNQKRRNWDPSSRQTKRSRHRSSPSSSAAAVVATMMILCSSGARPAMSLRASKLWKHSVVFSRSYQQLLPAVMEDRLRGGNVQRSSLASSAMMSTITNKSNNATQLSTTATTDRTMPQQISQTPVPIMADMDMDDLLSNWRSHPALNPTIVAPTLQIQDSSDLSNLLRGKMLQRYLISNWKLARHLQQRIKAVVKNTTNGSPPRQRLVLLHPGANWDDLPASVQTNLMAVGATPGPLQTLSFTATQFTAAYILATVLPSHVHPPPSSFETVGPIAHLNLRPHHVPYGNLIGQVLLSTLPHLRTVVYKVGDVTGPYRTYDLAVAAGDPNTTVQLSEAGATLTLDLARVYWSTRLGQERTRLLTDCFRPQQTIADVFCGVGALCVRAAREHGCTIVANDWNPHAMAALQHNMRHNGVASYLALATCQDAYDFLMDLGQQARLPDHVVMNYPLEAPRFLGALRWWPTSCNDNAVPRLHVYTFARHDDASHRTAAQVALDDIVTQLLPSPGAPTGRHEELDQQYDAHTHVHHVRDVAPGKLVLCVSLDVTSRLLRHMQGDF